MKISLATDALSLQEAADYLKMSEKAIGLAVVDDKVRYGIIAKGWAGVAHMHPSLSLPGVQFVEGAENLRTWNIKKVEDNKKLGIAKWSQREETTGFTVITSECYLWQFWYLSRHQSHDLFYSQNKSIMVKYLEPLDGALLHKQNSDAFPWPNFVVSILERNKDYLSRLTTKDDLLFLRHDLDALRVKLGLPQKDCPMSRREQQLQFILECIEKLGYRSQAIPTGGKTEIRRICLEHQALFTVASFGHAWKAGGGAGLWKMKEYDKFAASE